MAPFYGLIAPRIARIAPEIANRASRDLGRRTGLPVRVQEFPSAIFVAAGDLLPLQGKDTGGTPLPFVLGDLRLDNRAELAAALDFPSTTPLDDAELVARAYRRWPGGLAERIEGDFGFALWDPHVGRLHLYRDRFGVRPIFFRAGQDRIEFASEQHVLRHGERPVIDRDHISGFLAGIPVHPAETTTPGVERLRPAEQLVWSGETAIRTRYWTLARGEAPTADRPQELRRRLADAVARRTTLDGRTGAMLSGGLDSSATSLLASRALDAAGAPPLRSYSNVYPRYPEIDERHWIDAVLSVGRFDPRFLEVADSDPIGPMAAAQVALGGLVTAPGLPKTRLLYRAARADGVRQMLNGHGGDEVISHGTMRLLQLAQEGRLAAALSLVPTHVRATGENALDVVRALAKVAPGPFAGRFLRGALRRMAPATSGGTDSRLKLISGDFAARSAVRDRLADTLRGGGATLSERIANFHLNQVSGPLVGAGFETLGWLSSSEGIEERYPFFDRAVVEFCVALPESEKFRRGETRSILRRAMTGIYPEAVRRRRGKVRYNSELARGILTFQSARLDRLRRGTSELSGIIDQTALTAALDELTAGRERCADETVMAVWKVMMLDLLLVENSANFSFRF